jgi:hypothetical protein
VVYSLFSYHQKNLGGPGSSKGKLERIRAGLTLSIANHFNSFFTSIGEEIANSVPPVGKKPEDFIGYGRDIPNMLLGNTTVEHVIKTIKKISVKKQL